MNHSAMPSRIIASMSVFYTSFWIITNVSRVKVAHEVAITDDFGNLVRADTFLMGHFYNSPTLSSLYSL